MKILLLNSGLSSQQACLHDIGETLPDHPPSCLWQGGGDFGDGSAAIAVKNSRPVVQKEQIQFSSRQRAGEYDQVKYVSEDVTARRFTPKFAVVLLK